MNKPTGTIMFLWRLRNDIIFAAPLDRQKCRLANRQRDPISRVFHQRIVANKDQMPIYPQETNNSGSGLMDRARHSLRSDNSGRWHIHKVLKDALRGFWWFLEHGQRFPVNFGHRQDYPQAGVYKDVFPIFLLAQ